MGGNETPALLISSRTCRRVPVRLAAVDLASVPPSVDGLLLPQRICERAAGFGEPLDLSHLRDIALQGGFASLCHALSAPLLGPDVSPGLSSLNSLYKSAFPEDDPLPTVDVRMGEDEVLSVVELFHGPTASFKDYALLPTVLCMEKILRGDGTEPAARAECVVATSGDTGSAAIEGVLRCASPETLSLAVLFPGSQRSNVSALQRRQMTCGHEHARNIGVFVSENGDFDDVDAVASRLIATRSTDSCGGRLAAVNSKNPVRIIFQLTHYFWAYFLAREAILGRLGASVEPSQLWPELDVVIPTGGMGNAVSSICAKILGLPLGRVVVASNGNDCIHEWLSSGVFRRSPRPVRTMAPAMDISNPYNFERFLFLMEIQAESESLPSDGHKDELLFESVVNAASARVKAHMRSLETENEFSVSPATLYTARQSLGTVRVGQNEVEAAMTDAYSRSNYVADSHTCVGLAAARQHVKSLASSPRHPPLVLATAHALKTEKDVKRVLGNDVPFQVPASLARFLGTEETEDCFHIDVSSGGRELLVSAVSAWFRAQRFRSNWLRRRRFGAVESSNEEMTSDVALACAREAATIASLSAEGARIARLAASTSVDIEPVSVFARIETPSKIDVARRQVSSARFLRESGVSGARLISGDQPFEVSRGCVTLWERLVVSAENPTPTVLGEFLRKVHDATPPSSTPAHLPLHDPFTLAWQFLDSRQSPKAPIPGDNELRDAIREMELRWPELAEQDPRGIGWIHGDYHNENLVYCSTTGGVGNLVLLDLEMSGVGPRTFDLVPSILSIEKYGRPTSDLAEFLEAFGAVDVEQQLEDSGSLVRQFCRAYELLMIAWAVGNRDCSEAQELEAQVRMASFRGDVLPYGRTSWAML